MEKNSKTEVYTAHGLVRPLGQEDTSGNKNWCSCRNNLAGLSESQRVCSFVCLFVGARHARVFRVGALCLEPSPRADKQPNEQKHVL